MNTLNKISDLLKAMQITNESIAGMISCVEKRPGSEKYLLEYLEKNQEFLSNKTHISEKTTLIFMYIGRLTRVFGNNPILFPMKKPQKGEYHPPIPKHSSMDGIHSK
ncbi:MAG: hypothetical protein MJZ61_09715 [Bacteroidales bacterium]|nr:hypothetical protein [Bacteroidales bacterium]